ncbi:MAG: peroxiredoxin, partial [Candidatus Neomarinimicrobiota bacterium]
RIIGLAMRSTLPLALLITTALLASGAMLAAADTPKEGDLAPDFTLPDHDEVDRTLSDYRGQKVLVYFYPKDDTPGCTKEACGLRDAQAEYETANIVVLGISYDSPESHRKFREKHDLPFALLSDSKKAVAALYGAKGFYPLALRRSFLIDEEGRIVKIIKDVDVTSHNEDVLRYFRAAADLP